MVYGFGPLPGAKSSAADIVFDAPVLSVRGESAYQCQRSHDVITETKDDEAGKDAYADSDTEED